MGTVNVVMKYGTQTPTLPLLVVKGAGPSLLGRIKLDWHDVFWLQNPSLTKVIDRHKAVF